MVFDHVLLNGIMDFDHGSSWSTMVVQDRPWPTVVTWKQSEKLFELYNFSCNDHYCHIYVILIVVTRVTHTTTGKLDESATFAKSKSCNFVIMSQI